MKNRCFKIVLIGLLFCLAGSTATFAAKPGNKADKQTIQCTEAWLKAFYAAYCSNIAGPKSDPTLLGQYATPKLVAKVETAMEKSDGNPIIKGQDFNEKAIETITATHVSGAWHAVAYFDAYTRKCVIIPIKVVTIDGVLRLDDIGIE